MGQNESDIRLSVREIFIGLLLVASLGMVGVLTWEAFDSSRSHRATAQNALHDYSAFAAREFVRRAQSDLGYDLYDIATAFRGTEYAGTPTRSELAAGKTDRVVEALELVSTIFRVTPDGVTTSGEELSDGARAFLEREFLEFIENRPRAGRSSEAFYRWIEDRRHIFVFYPPDSPDDAVLGFEVDLERLPFVFDTVIGGEPLLPATAGSSAISNDGLALELVDGQRKLYTSGGYFDRYTGVEIEIDDEFSGLMTGSVLRCSIGNEAAKQLLAGGLPPLRLPFLLGVTLLTFSLLITAIVLFRREVELSRMRTDFISSVSHELRTPLTQIRMFSETLRLKRVRSVEEEERALEIIDQEAKRLGHLVENILQFSRAERGALRLDLEPLSLGEIVPPMIEGFAPLARSAGVDIEIDIRSHGFVRADRDAIHQILINFLDNAIKYGPRGQKVVVGVSEGDRTVDLWVEDQGPGIPVDARAKVWDRFQRLAGDDSGIAGAGIGLAVVRELVSLQGGSVTVDAGRNGGARFTVMLPRPRSGDAGALRESEVF